MLSPRYMKNLPNGLEKYYQGLEDDILRDIIRRIKKAGTLTETGNIQIESLLNLGYDLKEIKKEIVKNIDMTANKFGRIVKKAGFDSYQNDVKYYLKGGKKLENIPQVKNIITGITNNSVSDFKNITGTLGLAGKPLEQFYKDKLNQAFINISSGAFSSDQMIRKTINELGDAGLQVINYKSGRNFSLEAAVKMNLNSTVNRLSAEISLQNARDMDQDLMEITAHEGARPTHQDWQGQIVSLSGDSKYLSLNDIGFGQADGFMGVNCRHNWYPFFEGLSEKYWTKEKLQELNSEEFEYEGKIYDSYTANQRVRAIERSIRKSNRKIVMYDEVGDKKGKLNETIKLQIKKQEQSKFNEAMYNTDKEAYNKTKEVINNNLLKTLENFEKYSKVYYKENIKGLLSKEDEELIRNTLHKVINNSEFSMRFKSKNCDSLLKSNRFMNQFETGTSGGMISNKYRKEATKQLFGTGNKRFKASEREKYGYLGNNNFLEDYKFNREYMSGVNQYGDMIIRFNKNIQNRITMTVDNSLANACYQRIIASPVDKVNINCIERDYLSEFKDIIKNNSLTSSEDLTKALDVRYIELQYHGEITLKDVSEICFTGDVPNNINKFKDLGIKLFKIEGDNIVEI